MDSRHARDNSPTLRRRVSCGRRRHGGFESPDAAGHKDGRIRIHGRHVADIHRNVQAQIPFLVPRFAAHMPCGANRLQPDLHVHGQCSADGGDMLFRRHFQDVGHVRMQLDHSVVDYTAAGPVGILLLHTTAGAVLHMPVGTGDRKYRLFRTVAVHALFHNGASRLGDTARAARLSERFQGSQTAALRNRLDRRPALGRDAAMHRIRVLLRRILRPFLVSAYPHRMYRRLHRPRPEHLSSLVGQTSFHR